MIFTTLAQLRNPLIGPLGDPGAKAGEPLAQLLATVIRFLVIAGAIAMILYFILGAISWITSGGNPEKVEKASGQITQAITGMLILAGVIAIVSLLGSALGFDLLNIELTGVTE